MIAITPHIVRTPDYSPENMRTIYAGSDQNIRVIHEQLPDAAPVILPAVRPSRKPGQRFLEPLPQRRSGGYPIATTGAAAAGSSLVAGGPALTARVGAPPAPGPAAAATPATTSTATAQLSFSPGRVQVAPGGIFHVSRVQLDGASDLYSLSPLQIKFDPAQVRLNDASAGDLLTRDGVRVTKQQDIRNDAGEATVTFTRLPGAKRRYRIGRAGHAVVFGDGKGIGHGIDHRREPEELADGAGSRRSWQAFR